MQNRSGNHGPAWRQTWNSHFPIPVILTAAVSPRTILKMHIPTPQLRPTESGTLGVGPNNLCFTKSSNTLKLKNACAGMSVPQQATDCPAPQSRF